MLGVPPLQEGPKQGSGAELGHGGKRQSSCAAQRCWESALGTNMAPFPLSQLLFRNQLLRVGPPARACCQGSGQRWALSLLQPR